MESPLIFITKKFEERESERDKGKVLKEKEVIETPLKGVSNYE